MFRIFMFMNSILGTAVFFVMQASLLGFTPNPVIQFLNAFCAGVSLTLALVPSRKDTTALPEVKK